MISLPYVLFFIFLLCTAFLEFQLEKEGQLKVVRWGVLIFSVIFFGLRGHILTDFLNYYRFHEAFEVSNMFTANGLYEPGFIFYTYLCKQIFDNYFFWIFVLSLLHVFALKHLFEKYIGNFSLGLIFFLGYRGIVMEFNLLQNFMSILLFLLSIPYISKRKFIPYFLINLLGITFHSSSIIYLPLFFVLNKNISKRLSIIIVLVSNLFFLGGSEILIKMVFWVVAVVLPSSLEPYLYYFLDVSSYGLTFGYFERTIVIALIIFFSDKLKQEVPHGVILYNLSLFYYSFFLLLSPIDVLTDRIPILFLPALWILPACILFIRNRYRPVLAVFLITLSFAKLVQSTRDKVARYDNLLFGISSYEERSAEVIEHNSNQK